MTVPAARAGAGGALLCLPPAGTGRLAFASWPERVGPLHVEPVLYPGRDARVREPVATTIMGLVRDVLECHGGAIAAGGYAVLGRSVGAGVAMHLVQELVRSELPLPRLVVVVASRPPQHPDPESPLFRLPSQRLRERIADWGGMTQRELDDDELMSWVQRLVRADLAVVETAAELREPIPVPLVAVGAAADASVPVDLVEGWSAWTTSTFAAHVLPGGHFPDVEQEQRLIALLERTLAEQSPDQAAVSGSPSRGHL